MRKMVFSLVLAIPLVANAQFKDEFNDNRLGWTEEQSVGREAIIEDGVMKLSAGENEGTFTYCYAPIDITQDFVLEFDATYKKYKQKEGSNMGFCLDYLDDGNYIYVYCLYDELKKVDRVTLCRYVDYKLVGQNTGIVKLPKRKKDVPVHFKIRYETQKLIVEIDGMKAVERRYLELKSTGIGFAAKNDAKVFFDNLEIKQ